MLEEKTFNTGQININYVELGSGPPLLLLHGHSHSYLSFISMIPTLSTYYHVYALDFRGHGKSDRTPGKYSILDMTGDIITFIQQVIKEPTHIYGHSGGGLFTLVLNAEIPHLVKSIIFADPSIFFHSLKDNAALMYYWNNLIIPFAGSSVDIFALIDLMGEIEFNVGEKKIKYIDIEPLKSRINNAQSLKLLDPDFAHYLFEKFDESVFGYDPEKCLSLVKCPVLIIQADPQVSSLFTTEMVDKIKKDFIPQALVYTLKGTGHLLHEINQSEILELMLRFLSTLD